jgi:hypothetical protein
MKNQLTCGCDCHELDPDDNNVVVWQSRTWNPTCALKASIKALGKNTEELNEVKEQFTSVQKLYHDLNASIENMNCSECLRKVGRDWVFCQGSICCNTCLDYVRGD